MRLCKIIGCDKKHEAKGFCKKHYKRFKRNGDPLLQYANKICIITGCNNKHKGYGYCDMHYQRLKKYGSPLYTKNIMHGLSGTPEYKAWDSMIQRCYNKNNMNYKRYGSRGITVCNQWKYSFLAFYEDMGERPSLIHQLDRIDNDGNYKPDNCRWVTPEENCRNRSTTKCTINKVNNIRDMYNTGKYTQNEIAKLNDVNQGYISLIVNNKSWKDVI